LYVHNNYLNLEFTFEDGYCDHNMKEVYSFNYKWVYYEMYFQFNAKLTKA